MAEQHSQGWRSPVREPATSLSMADLMRNLDGMPEDDDANDDILDPSVALAAPAEDPGPPSDQSEVSRHDICAVFCSS